MPTDKKSTQPKKNSRRVVKKNSPVEEITNDVQTEPSMETTTATKSTGTLQQITQQLNMLLILGIALFLFNMYLFWKIKNIETKVANGPSVAGAQQQQQQVNVSMDQIKKLFGKEFIHFGDTKRKILFVEFSDPSCPYCHIAGGENPELNEQAGAQFKLVSQGGTYKAPVQEMRKLVDEGKASYAMIYRNGHGNGELAAQALYCANEKGKFWEVHDLLMSNAGYSLVNEKVQNDKANIPVLVDFVSSAIDPTFLTQCLDSGKYAETLKRDTNIGNEFGVGGTPGFFVNTTHFPGAYSFADMEPAVDQASKS